MQPCLIIGDVHLREVNKKLTEKLFSILIDCANSKSIKNIKFLGDLYNQRAVIRTEFQRILIKGFAKMVKAGLDIDVIVGNHDYDALDNNDAHSLEVLPWLFGKSVRVYSKNFYDSEDKCLYLPYSTDYAAIKEILNNDIEYIFCHLPISGFDLTSFHKETKGIPPEWFKKAKEVHAGHFHGPQTEHNITYAGSIFINSFAEANVTPTFLIHTNGSTVREAITNWMPEVPLYHYIKTDKLVETKWVNDNNYKFVIVKKTTEQCKELREQILDSIGYCKCFVQFQYITENLNQERISENLSMKDMYVQYIDKFHKGSEQLKIKGLKYMEAQDANI